MGWVTLGRLRVFSGAYTVACSLLGWSLAATPEAGAQISLDGTLGPKGPINPVGGNFNIQSTYGQTVGSNLFHSFDQFNIGTGQTATFSAPAGAGITNVISRVTGGSSSNIDGTLQSTIPGADVYLINPSGVVFGPNAKLNVQGSFAATTANHVTLKDGNRFSASQPSTSVLTSAPPSAFGFLPPAAGAVPKAIAVNGSNLAVPAGKQLSLVGGNVTIQGNGQTGAAAAGAQLSAPAGRINVVSVASAGEAAFNPADNGALVDTSGFPSLGSVAISQGSLLSTSDGGTAVDAQGFGGGSIVLRAGQLSIDASSILAQPGGAAAGRFIDIGVTGAMTMTDGAVIGAQSFGSGAGGAVRISAGDLSITGMGPATANFSEGIYTVSTAGGAAGAISVNASTLELLDGAEMYASGRAAGASGNITLTLAGALTVDGGFITSDTFGAASGGQIKIAAGDVSVSNSGLIGTRTIGTGAAGDITISSGTLELASAGSLDSRTVTPVADANGNLIQGGAGGNVFVALTGALTVNGGIIGSSTSGSGAAGDVRISAASVAFSNGGFVLSSTSSTGKGGIIRIDTPGALTINNPDSGLSVFSTGTGAVAGDAGSILIHAGSLQISDSATIQAETQSNGAGGNVIIDVAGAMQLLDGGAIFVSTGQGAGKGGDLLVNAATLTISGLGSTSTYDPADINIASSGSGDAGTATLKVGTLTLSQRALINASSLGSGKGGELFINATQGVNVLAGGFISSQALSSGAGGDVHITAPELTVSGQSNNFLSAIQADAGSSSGAVTTTGPAGNLNLQVGNLTVGGRGLISSNTFDAGKGGDIVVDATGSVSVQGLISASSQAIFQGNTYLTGTGPSGNVIINAQSLTVAGGSPARLHGAIRSSTPGAAPGGDIVITLSGALQDAGTIDASTSGAGAGGAIRISAPSVMLSGNTATAGGSINASSSGAGAGGSITINSPNVVVTDEGTIRSDAVPPGDLNTFTPATVSGPAGSVTINAGSGSVQVTSGGTINANNLNGAGGVISISAHSLTVSGTGPALASGESVITSEIGVFSLGAGQAGDILVNAQSVVLSDGGYLSSSGFGTASGGNISINAPSGSVELVSGGSLSAFGELAAGGAITVSAQNLLVSGEAGPDNRSTISTSSFGAGKGGDIEVTCTNISVNQDGFISSGAFRAGDGGDVKITAYSRLQIASGGGVSSNSNSTTGFGGTVIINAGRLNITGDPGNVLQTGVLANAFDGNAGDINITAQTGIHLTNGSAISTDAKTGGGVISIDLGPGALLVASDSIIATRSLGERTAGGAVVIRGGNAIVLTDSPIDATNPNDAGGAIDIETSNYFGNITAGFVLPAAFNESGQPSLLFATDSRTPVNAVMVQSVQQLTSRKPNLLVVDQYPASAAQKQEAADVARAYVAKATGQAPLPTPATRPVSASPRIGAPAPTSKPGRRAPPAATQAARTAEVPRIIAAEVTTKTGSTAVRAVVLIDVNTRQLARPDVYEITTKPDNGDQLTLGGISAPFVSRGGGATENP